MLKVAGHVRACIAAGGLQGEPRHRLMAQPLVKAGAGFWLRHRLGVGMRALLVDGSGAEAGQGGPEIGAGMLPTV